MTERNLKYNQKQKYIGSRIFQELRALIREEANNHTKSFDDSSETLKEKIRMLNRIDFEQLILEIGVIPEDIDHDSTEEKLFSKTTDIILARSFQELGLFASVNKERANCADVVAKSNIHGYSLVGDAKAFRLSRTAKNQKDFKVKSLVDWKGEHDFSVLVCPYYQYPKNNSQIYGQALDHNVCLLSWEHLLLVLNQNISESKSINLSCVWNMSNTLASLVTIKDKNRNINFHHTGNKILCESLNIELSKLNALFTQSKTSIIKRGESEMIFWQDKIGEIQQYSREQAIKELLSALKLKEKIVTIKKYIDSLRDEV